MPAPQNFKNHGRIDPLFHLFISPMLLLNLGFAIRTTTHDWPAHQSLNVWWIVMSVVFLVMAMKTRMYALKVQDRVIRLEEQLRLAAILPPSEQGKIANISARQLIALRFAADKELAALALRASGTENLSPKTIKENIVDWRPDNHRV
jgi:hypothetical protein